ncbi:MAG: hypothetical protein E2O46_00600 [Ignavibacteria bacterium]|jgi:hypothetical protein|nr:MAG: hypothetical protein E2O46_00600 [Ignavibacteria bacterium]
MFGLKTSVKIILPAIIIFILSSSGFAQEDIKDKLSKIEGHVDKITISAGGEEFTFEGEDAEKLFNRMQSNTKSSNTFIVKIDEGGEGTKKIIIKSYGGDEEVYEFKTDGGDHAVWFSDDDCFHNLGKEIKIEIEDGNKKVTVTTKENGEEKTEIYEGEEAEEYLDKMKSEHGHEMLIEIDEDGEYHKMKKIIIEKKVIKDKNDK